MLITSDNIHSHFLLDSVSDFDFEKAAKDIFHADMSYCVGLYL